MMCAFRVKSDTNFTMRRKVSRLQSILHDSKLFRKSNLPCLGSLCRTVIFRRFRHCAGIRCHESRLHSSSPNTKFIKRVPVCRWPHCARESEQHVTSVSIFFRWCVGTGLIKVWILMTTVRCAKRGSSVCDTICGDPSQRGGSN